MLANLLFAILLVGAAALLARHSERGWRAVRDQGLDQHERTYHVRRRWRRLSIATLIALIGLVIPLFTIVATVLIAWVYLLGLVAAVLLMLVMAFLDLIATQAYFTHEKERFAQARDDLKMELKRARERKEDGNGKAG